MKVSEIFASIQGEGISLGTPSVFLRLALCNLHCKWCDTPYTWNWGDRKKKEFGLPTFDYQTEIKTMNVAQVAAAIRRYDLPNVLITGGEPLFQQHELSDLVSELEDKRIEVETNGTIIPAPEFALHVAQWNVSPKLANSGNDITTRNKPALSIFATMGNAYFKFVVCNKEDLAEVEEMVTSSAIQRSRVLLMPEATTPEQHKERSLWLVEEAKAHGFRYTPRLQVLLWDAQRGK